MVLTSQRTVYNIALHLSMLFNKSYTLLSNTTMNEKFEIEAGNIIPEGRYPTLKYIGIGIGGNAVIENSNAYTYSEHSPIQGVLYEHIPFVLRKPNNDITLGERVKYRFRKVINIDGDPYIAYYLKVIDNFDLRDNFFNIKQTPEGSVLSVFDTNIPEILNPIPHNRNIVYDSDMEYITKIANIKFILTNEELKELNNVLTILNKNTSTITEIVLATGIDKILNDGSIEATCVQAGFYVNMNLDITNQLKNNLSITKSIELGGTEPMRL